MKTSTLVLIISIRDGFPSLIDKLVDSNEIELLEKALQSGKVHPLEEIYLYRETQLKRENDFGDYLEEMLSQPFVAKNIRDNGIQWLKSRIKIEQYQKNEREAAEIITRYAYRIFQHDRSKTDFLLVSPTSQVRIRVLELPGNASSDAF